MIVQEFLVGSYIHYLVWNVKLSLPITVPHFLHHMSATLRLIPIRQ
jgi:hypothetical protein